MPAGLQIFNESGQVVFDTNDRVLGGIYTISTGTSNGSHAPTLQPGQKAAFYFRLPGVWTPSGTASPWPGITSFDDKVQWSFSPGAIARNPVEITVAIY